MPASPTEFDEATFLRFFGTLNERQARLCAAERALALGWGGITRLARLTGLAPRTIRNGIAELRGPAALERGRKIGRASCRERVKISVGAVSLKKKTSTETTADN